MYNNIQRLYIYAYKKFMVTKRKTQNNKTLCPRAVNKVKRKKWKNLYKT